MQDQQQYNPPVMQQHTQQVHAAPVAVQPQMVGTSGMAITSLVLGILAIVTSWMPILNNGSFFLAILGVIFAIVGLVGISKGKKKGKGLAIAGLVLGVISCALVLITQSMYGAAIDAASESISPSVTASSASSSSTSSSDDASASDSSAAGSEASSESQEVDYTNLSMGDSIELTDGTIVAVTSVQTGLVNYDDSPLSQVTVTYQNNGDKEVSFNPYDWKAQDAQGALYSQTFYMDGENELSSGDLAPGGSVSGNIYFDGDVTKISYCSNMFNDSATASWVVE